jgi:hypothetical protein
MKAKLIKTDVNYLLEDDKGVIIASTSTKEGNNKLSKQNCDEIFWGLYDTEIEVEIVMKNSRTGKIIKSESDLTWNEDGLCDRAVPKLDSDGCLILIKKI